MRRLALVAAYIAIVLFRAGPASGADAVAVAKICGFVGVGNGLAALSPLRAD